MQELQSEGDFYAGFRRRLGGQTICPYKGKSCESETKSLVETLGSWRSQKSTTSKESWKDWEKPIQKRSQGEPKYKPTIGNAVGTGCYASIWSQFSLVARHGATWFNVLLAGFGSCFGLISFYLYIINFCNGSIYPVPFVYHQSEFSFWFILRFVANSLHYVSEEILNLYLSVVLEPLKLYHLSDMG